MFSSGDLYASSLQLLTCSKFIYQFRLIIFFKRYDKLDVLHYNLSYPFVESVNRHILVPVFVSLISVYLIS